MRLLRRLLPKSLRRAYHLVLAVVARWMYGNPSRRLTVIGVTGTHGKSSVVMLLGQVLTAAGFRTGYFSTAMISDGRRTWFNALKMTMPGRFVLQRFLRQCVRNGCTHAVIETSSEGIAQHRHRGIAYDVAVLTNLGEEHLEAHGGFANYRAAKAKLFAHAARSGKVQRIAVIPADLAQFEQFTAHPFTAVQTFDAAHGRGYAPAISAFPDNVAAVLAVCDALGIARSVSESALRALTALPGRLESLDEGQPFAVMVDYAHTPAALTQVAAFVQAHGAVRGKVIHVLGGVGGGRDRAKRAAMGSIAAAHAAVVIVTNEDPYDDDPMTIIRAVADGARAGAGRGTIVEEILDRREAFVRALALAQPGDLVLVTGKGCEQAIAGPHGTNVPWDDRVVVRELLRMQTYAPR
ncbi:MAG: Mur ligase family protein [bacterium]|nr:Mur ligase family protein [bacterium]